MKKGLFLLFFVWVFFLYSCGSGGEQSQTESADSLLSETDKSQGHTGITSEDERLSDPLAQSWNQYIGSILDATNPQVLNNPQWESVLGFQSVVNALQSFNYSLLEFQVLEGKPYFSYICPPTAPPHTQTYILYFAEEDSAQFNLAFFEEH